MVLLDFGTAFARPVECPECGATEFVVEVEDDRTLWRCVMCSVRIGRQGRTVMIPLQPGPPPTEQGPP